MCDRRQVKHTVCRTSKCHIDGKCIQKCFFCHNVSWTDIFIIKLHYFHTCMFRKFDSFGINGRNRTISLKSHTNCLRQAVHTVCGIHTGTGTTGRTSMAYKIVYFFFRHFTCCMCTDCFKHTGKTGFLSLYMTGKHRATADKYSRNIDSGCCHQKSRYVFITVWHHNECIKCMSKCHTFGRICDQVTGNK